MRLLTAITVYLLLIGCLQADPPKLTIPAEVRPTGQYVSLLPDTDAVSVVYIGLSGIDAIPSEWLKDSRRFALDTRGLAAGRYGFAAVAASKTGETARADFTVVIGTPPTPPIPPGPGPKPPEPPTPTPVPIPEMGFRVLIVLETADISGLPAAQQSALTNTKTILPYLQRKCVKGPDGRTAEWRIWDKDVNLGGERILWQQAMGKALADYLTNKGSLPWIIISDGKTGHSGPLPGNSADLLELLKRYGGE